MAWCLGIDIGSSTSKGIVSSDGDVVARHLLPSGVDYRVAAQKLIDELLAMADVSREDIACTVATGQGSANVEFADQQVADIRCCARGIYSIYPSVRTVIDVQGQSTQVLRLSSKVRWPTSSSVRNVPAGAGVFLT